MNYQTLKDMPDSEVNAELSRLTDVARGIQFCSDSAPRTALNDVLARCFEVQWGVDAMIGVASRLGSKKPLMLTPAPILARACLFVLAAPKQRRRLAA